MSVISNTIKATDIAPAISIDLSSNLAKNIDELRRALGIGRAIPVSEGSSIAIYDAVAGTLADQPNEGDVINLTKVTRSSVATINMTLKFYRKLVTSPAIQKSGLDNALNDTDAALVAKVRGAIKSDFFTNLDSGTGTASVAENATFQQKCAAAWGAIQTGYEDTDATPVFFANPADVATYLGTAAITTQEAFGVRYLENFLGLGTLFISSKVDAGEVWATAAENLGCAYVPATGDVGTALGLTADETGVVGITHGVNTERAAVESLVVTGVSFYAENLALVYKTSTSAASS